MLIREAKDCDVPAITVIYNEAIIKTTATFDLDPVSLVNRQQWFHSHGVRYPVLVAEDEATGEIMGWGSLSPFSDKPAYLVTAEHSIYVSAKYQGQGVGTALLQELLRLAAQNGFRSLVARITAENTTSLNLHTKFGFNQVGLLVQVGRKFERWLDVVLMQKLL